MADISAKSVNELRQRTGCGLMDCKKALLEADGDIERGIELLRQRGLAKAAKRADREQREGTVALAFSADRTAGALLELNCETDFVARSEAFVAFADAAARAVCADARCADAEALRAATHPAGGTFGQKLDDLTNSLREHLGLGHIARRQVGSGWIDGYVHFDRKRGAMVELTWSGGARPAEPPEGLGKDLGMQIVVPPIPLALRREDLPAAEVEKERRVHLGADDIQKKPEAIRPKIVEGRMSKWYQEQVLLEQPYIKDDRQSVATHVASAGGGRVTLTGYDCAIVGA